MSFPTSTRAILSHLQGRMAHLAVTLACLATAGNTLASLPADWHFSSAYPTQNALNAVWAQSANSVYVAGDGGVILHWDGTAWTDMPTPTERPLFAVHGSAGDDIWAVGGDSYQPTNDDRSVILHYDGTSWSEVPAPGDWAGQKLTLSQVWAVSPTEAWAITETNLSLFRWDGTSWESVDYAGSIPGAFPEGGMNDVRWVDGLGLFLVGTHGQIIRFDGTEWFLEQKLEEGNFSTSIMTSIHAVDADHVYAGHNWGTVYQRNPDGTWTDLELGEGGFFGSGQILDIRGDSPDDLYFFVDRKIRHFTGSAPTDNTEFGNEVRGGWLAADAVGDQLFVVSNQGGVYQFDTTTSTLSPLGFSHRSYFNGRLNGATAYGTDQLLLYGNGMHYSDPAMALAVFDGAHITPYPAGNLPENATHKANMIDAATGPGGEISVVFEDLQTHRNGIYSLQQSGWVRRPGNYFTSGLQLDYSSSGKLFMGDAQSVAYWPDDVSTPVELLRLTLGQAQDGYFTALWAPADNRVFVGAYDGQIRRWDGTTWLPEATLTDTEIGAIHGDATHVYAIAYKDGTYRDSGQLWHRSTDGTWTQVPLVPDLAVKPIGFATGKDGIYFAYSTPGNYFGGGRTFVRKLEGAAAVGQVSGLSGQYEAICSNANGDIVLVHSGGAVVTNAGRPASFSPGGVPLDAGTWSSFPAAGVSVSPSADSGGSSFFVSWNTPTVRSPIPIPERYTPGSEQWVIGQDSARTPAASPQFRFRFNYHPDRLPPGFDPSVLVMLRFDGNTWEPVPATIDEAQGFIETSVPTSTSTWVVAIDTEKPATPPSLSITPAGPGAIALTWPAGPGLELYTSPTLLQGSWTRVTETPVQVDDSMILTISPAGGERFFRLAK